jgi:hypothetical protein
MESAVRGIGEEKQEDYRACSDSASDLLQIRKELATQSYVHGSLIRSRCLAHIPVG